MSLTRLDPAQQSISKAFTFGVMARIDAMRLRTAAVNRSAHTGGQRSRQRGKSLEFADLRQYAAGDEPRDIDWNAVARFDALLTKTFALEIAVPLTCVVDASPSMRWQATTDLALGHSFDGGVGPKLLCALRAALALMLVAASVDTPASLDLVKATPLRVRQRNDSRAAMARADALDLAELPDSVEALCARLEALARQRYQHTVVVFTDGYELEVLTASLSRLRTMGARVTVVQILHRDELSPPLSGELGLVDCEDRTEAQVVIDRDELEGYRQRCHEFLSAWQQTCRRLGVGYGPLFSDLSVEVALDAMMKAGLIERRQRA